uniref:Ig-like domain-containing protein n=1 Tax=Xiphophorus couchianus TaxID=32473 RepID=A0A3B5MCI2_9TELE
CEFPQHVCCLCVILLSVISGFGSAAAQVASNQTWFCFLALPGQQQVKVKLGQNVSLECLGPSDEDVLLFTWTKVGLDSDHVFFYRNGRSYESYQHESLRGRVDLRSSLKDGDFSVVLHNVSKRDEGTYHCVIITQRSGGHDGNRHSFVNLTVSGEFPAVDPSGQTVKTA